MSLQDLKNILIEEGIVKIKSKDEEPFTLKSGKKSRLFFDVKEASLNPDILKVILESINIEYIKEFDKIGSVAVGGVPLATALSLKSGIPQIIVRSEKHDRGTQTKIIGDCKNQNVILIEDVATSGGSIVNVVDDIRKAGGICNHCIVVVNRQEGADEACSSFSGIKLQSLLTKKDFGITNE